MSRLPVVKKDTQKMSWLNPFAIPIATAMPAVDDEVAKAQSNHDAVLQSYHDESKALPRSSCCVHKKSSWNAVPKILNSLSRYSRKLLKVLGKKIAGNAALFRLHSEQQGRAAAAVDTSGQFLVSNSARKLRTAVLSGAAAFVAPRLIEDPLARYRGMTRAQLQTTFTDLHTLKKVLGHVPTVSNPNPMVVPLLSLIADKGLLLPGGLAIPQLNVFRSYVGECGNGVMKCRALVTLLEGKLE
jgi:hypothetical protein